MTKDKVFNWRICFCCGIFIWFIINLLQGIFTEIQEDEAYYALYGEHLAWGYFDHPPMVGLMTFLSSIFFSGALGVRFFTIVASCLSLIVIWRIATFNDRPFDKLRDLAPTAQNKVVEPVETPTCKHVFLFFVLAFSIVMFNIYGFVTTPDVGLILFSALFLLVYQRYLADRSWKNALLMGLTMALMIYSKYHAFLLLGLIVLSNLKLLKDGKFWVACLLALVLLTPHILWQVNNDFPSIKYHLAGRNEAFRWSYFLEYLPNQLLIFNPFTFGVVVDVLIKDKCLLTPPCPPLRGGSLPDEKQSRDIVFERGLKFILIGFFFFFWLMAFRGHVEPHWTIVCVIPVVVLVFRKALIDERLRKYVHRFIMPSLFLVLSFRIILLTPGASQFGFCDKKNYYEAIGTAAGNCPVVFQGSFQRPALYHYYTGKPSSSLRCYYDRKTQFDLWQFDKDWIGKEVFVFGSLPRLSKEYHINGESFPGYLMQHFRSPNRLVISLKITNAGSEPVPIFHHGDTIHADFSIYNPCNAPIAFHGEDYNMHLNAHYFPGDETTYCFYDDFVEFPAHSNLEGHLFTIVGKHISLGKHRFNIGIGDPIASFVTEENGIEIKIEP